MTSIRHVLRSAAALAAAVTVLVACAAVAAPAAFATHVPPPGMGDLGTQVAPPVTVGGMPGWQITLIALAAALLGAVLAVVLDRARAAHQHSTAPTA